MTTITSDQASDVISDDYQTSPEAVEAVSQETVEEYVSVTEASDDTLLGYGSDAVEVEVDFGEAGEALNEMTDEEVGRVPEGVDQEQVMRDMGANFAVAYGREVANQALEVADGNKETVDEALSQAYNALEDASREHPDGAWFSRDSENLSTSGKVYLRDAVSPEGEEPHYQEVFEDFQEEVGEILG